MNAAQLALDSIDKYGDYTAFHADGRSVSSVEHATFSARLATVLRERGVKAGDRVLVVMHNCPEVLACFQAIWKIGAVIVPITPQLGEREIKYVMGHSDAVAVITSPELAPRIRSAAAGGEGLRHWLIIGESESDGFSNIYEAIAGADERDLPACHDMSLRGIAAETPAPARGLTTPNQVPRARDAPVSRPWAASM